MGRDRVTWRGNICAVITPFAEDGALDRGLFVENLELLISEGIDGFVVAGDTGEFWALSDEERFDLFKMAKATARGRVPVIGNASAMTTGGAIAYARECKEIGLDGIMLLPPYYVRPGQREIVAFFRAVSDAVDIPILLYNIPVRQGVNIPVDTVEQLADVPNIVAFKQSTPEFMEAVETIRRVGHKMRILTGHSVDRGLPCLVMGADGYLSSVEPQVMGKEAIDLYNLFTAGKIAEARALQMKLIELDHAIHGGVGTFPASLKAAMNLRGRPGGYPRLPLLYPTDEQMEKLRTILKKLNLL